jgi:ABC-type sugar transport system substrate-binding protein
MRKRSRFALALVAVAALCLPAVASPAAANHNCGLDGVSNTVNTICNNYHSPKVLLQYVECVATAQCPIG